MLSPDPMHDKSQGPSGQLFALSGHGLIALTGRDAAAFAQAQFMNDVALVGPGQWQWSGWLTPKGRVIALFALLRLDDETLWLLLPDADPGAVAAALKRFLFRSKAVIAVRDDLQVQGAFAAPLRAEGNAFAGDAAAGVELDMSGEGGARALRILPATTPEQPSEGDAVTDTESQVERWAAADLLHGLPRLPASQVEHWTPQQLSLERLRAFSVKKGCYPGQEIVARTHFLGKVKRGLMLLESDTPPPTGGELHAEGQPLGTIISAAHDAGRHLALAVVSLERASSATLSANGAPVRERSLQAGLAR